MASIPARCSLRILRAVLIEVFTFAPPVTPAKAELCSCVV